MIVQELFAKLGLKVDFAAFEGGTRLIDGLKKNLGKLAVAAGGYFAFIKVRDTINAATAAAGALVDTSDRLGVSVESLQKWGYAAELAGSSADGLVGGLGKLLKTIGDVKPDSPAAKALESLGISATDAALKTGDLESLVPRIADGFQKLKTPIERSEVAFGLFGKSGLEFIPLLQDGAQGLKDVGAELVDLGGVHSRGALAATDKLDDEFGKATKRLTFFFRGVVVKFTPVLAAFAKGMQAVVKGVLAFVKVITHPASLVALASLALAFAAVKAQALIARLSVISFSMANVKAALASALAWAKAALPFVALAAGIAMVILIVDDLWTWIQGGDSVLGDLYDSFRGWMRDGIGSIIEWLGEKFDDQLNWILDKAELARRKLAELMGQGLKEGESYDLLPSEVAAQEARNAARVKKNGEMLAAFRATQAAGASATLPASTSTSHSSVVNAPIAITVNGAGNPKMVADDTAAVVRRELDTHARKIKAGARR